MSRSGPETLVPGTVIACPWSEGSEGGHFKLELLDVLQKDGIFSKVYRCRDKATSREYLVKRVWLDGLVESDFRYRLREVDIWTKLSHPNILTCLTGWLSGPELWVLSRKARCSVERLVLTKDSPPPQALFGKWLFHLASALKYLHEDLNKPILHRNIKPSNVMVADDNYVLQLSDFGVSKQLEGKEDMTKSRVGTATIMSPEIVNNIPYNAKTDMWSLGITATFIATQQNAMHARTFDTLFRKAKNGEVRGIAGLYSREVERVINRLLRVDPQHRPTASQLITDLQLLFRDCSQPANADSYPGGREAVPPKQRDRAEASPRHRPGSGTAWGLDPAALEGFSARLAVSRKASRSSKATRESRRSCEEAEGSSRREAQRPGSVADRRTSGAAAGVERTSTGAQMTQHDSSAHEGCGPERQPSPGSALGSEATAASGARSAFTSTAQTSVERLSLTLIYILVDSRGSRFVSQLPAHLSPSRRPSSGTRRPRPRDTAAGAAGTTTAGSSTDENSAQPAPPCPRRQESSRAARDQNASTVDRPKREKTHRQVKETEDDVPAGMTTNVDMIYTFPGAFNIPKQLPTERPQSCLLRAPSVPETSRKRRTPVTQRRSESDARAVRDEDRASGVEGEAAEALQSVLPLGVPVENWPAKLRQYWTISRDLLSKLEADVFFTALKYARLFSKDEVKLWLQERAGHSAGECIDDILTLIRLDEQLDTSTVLALSQTLLSV